jgi:hypothetical protein
MLLIDIVVGYERNVKPLIINNVIQRTYVFNERKISGYIPHPYNMGCVQITQTYLNM